MEQEPRRTTTAADWQEYYRPLPLLYFCFLLIWSALLTAWTLNTWCKRHWETSNLQWLLTAVPSLKSLVLGLSFTFWYFCLNLSACSFWLGFGVFVTKIFFETVCFVCFLLIAHGYCIMHEQLSRDERRSIAGLSSLLYLTLTGYKAAVPQFGGLMVLMYMAVFFVIFFHVGRTLTALQDQLRQIQDDGVHTMHSAVYAKFTMLKKFQGTMLVMAVAQILVHARPDDIPNEYWLCLLLRELIEIGIFFHVGWTFRSREVTRFFTVIPSIHVPGQHILPPIYSEMNEKEFDSLDFKEWHIGVPTSVSKAASAASKSMLVIVQNPGIFHRRVLEELSETTGDDNNNTSVVCRSSAVQSYASLATTSKVVEEDDNHSDTPLVTTFSEENEDSSSIVKEIIVDVVTTGH